MKIIDRYIVKQFLLSFLFGLVAFLFIFIIIDMMEKLDDFIDAGAPTSVVLQYYVVFMPEILKLMTPVALLLGSLFVVGRDRKSTRLNSSHIQKSRMPSSA